MSVSRVFIYLLLLMISNQLNAKDIIRDVNKENSIENQLAEIAPSMVEIFKAGTIAMDQYNLPLADSLYSIVYQNAPTFDPLIRRLGTIRVQLGKYQDGIALCEEAVSLNRSAYNLISLASCYYYESNDSSSNVRKLNTALMLLKEAEKLPNGDEYDFPALICQISLQLNDIFEFRNATEKLINNYPDEMISHYYAALLAAYDEKWIKAKEEIIIAKNLGLSEEVVKEFLDSGVQSKVKIWNFAKLFLWITILWILGLILLFLVGKLLSNFTLGSLERLNGRTEISGSEKFLRSIYKSLINIGGFYYYISLPIILVLVVAVVVGLVYVFLLIGRIPIQLMLILIIGSCFTIYGMVRSLLVKVKYSDPGRELKEIEAPNLFKLTREVANTIGTRPVDEIRITPATDLAVYERGSWNEKLQDRAKRILILGTGILKDFRQDQFCAVLAHEYGHFSHRDTAGGEIALRVRNDMNKYFYALFSAGQNVWWNVAFQFLRFYNLIFRRISHGATRLQEVLADRVAAQTYGVVVFKNGLTYVIKRDIEFTKYANSEIEEAKIVNRPFNNLYELAGNNSSEIDDELTKALNRRTMEDDTHPSPIDRFRYINGINAPDIFVSNSLVKDLFLNWAEITAEMTAQIELQLKDR